MKASRALLGAVAPGSTSEGRAGVSYSQLPSRRPVRRGGSRFPACAGEEASRANFMASARLPFPRVKAALDVELLSLSDLARGAPVPRVFSGSSFLVSSRVNAPASRYS